LETPQYFKVSDVIVFQRHPLEPGETPLRLPEHPQVGQVVPVQYQMLQLRQTLLHNADSRAHAVLLSQGAEFPTPGLVHVE